MVKTGVFKKIAALTAAVAMLGAFAVSASAVTVTTTTQYTDSTGEKVNVIANVSGLSGAVEVTYYATDGNDIVYVDQTTANDAGAARFDYVTDATDLKSAVKVGYTNATAAETATIDAYTILINGSQVDVVPTEEINGTHTLEYVVTDGFKVTGVTAAAPAEATLVSYTGSDLVVSIAGATGDVSLTVEEAPAVTLPDPVAEHLGSAGIVSDGDQDTVESVVDGDEDTAHATKGNRKVSVLGKLLNVGADYGIVISDEAIVAGDNFDAAPEGSYAARAKNLEGQFAVQLIDDSEDGSWFAENGKYYTGLYFLNPVTNKYVVIAGGEITIQ